MRRTNTTTWVEFSILFSVSFSPALLTNSNQISWRKLPLNSNVSLLFRRRRRRGRGREGGKDDYRTITQQYLYQ